MFVNECINEHVRVKYTVSGVRLSNVTRVNLGEYLRYLCTTESYSQMQKAPCRHTPSIWVLKSM